jgi:periplasmic protein TonB
VQGRAIQHSAALDLDPTTLGRPKISGSFLLHAAFIAAIVAGHFVSHLFPHNQWGNQQAPGAIQATLVSSAIPLPQDTPPTPNVLATEMPSPAPAPPLPKIAPVPPPDAIPIPERKFKPPKKEEPKKVERPSPKFAQPQQQQYHAQYGEAPATSMPRSMAPTAPGPQTPVNVGGAEGFNYPWYVSLIQSKVAQSWYTQEVVPSTPIGSVAKVTFTIARDGSPSNFRISQSSGYPTLDSSALRAVERVENFSPLPSGYSKSSLFVEYTFTYRGAGPVR